MTNCPFCNKSGAYVGLFTVECANEECQHFNIKAPGYKPKVYSIPKAIEAPNLDLYSGEMFVRSLKASWTVESEKDFLDYHVVKPHDPYIPVQYKPVNIDIDDTKLGMFACSKLDFAIMRSLSKMPFEASLKMYITKDRAKNDCPGCEYEYKVLKNRKDSDGI